MKLRLKLDAILDFPDDLPLAEIRNQIVAEVEKEPGQTLMGIHLSPLEGDLLDIPF